MINDVTIQREDNRQRAAHKQRPYPYANTDISLSNHLLQLLQEQYPGFYPVFLWDLFGIFRATPVFRMGAAVI